LKKFAVIAIDSAIDYKFLLILLLNNSFIWCSLSTCDKL
jgi:hypothetical protein